LKANSPEVTTEAKTLTCEQKGRAEGKIEGQGNTILRQLNRKFGNLNNAIAEQIKSLKPIQLDSLTEDLLDFQSLDDLLIGSVILKSRLTFCDNCASWRVHSVNFLGSENYFKLPNP
jgi:hypothetical protein